MREADARPPLSERLSPAEERELLGIACVYAAVGGYTDAYAYVTHGLFANAQTGNVLFFALDASAGRWARAGEHVPPIVAFALGVVAAKLLGTKATKRTFRATLASMTIELAILAALVAIGARLPGQAVISIVAFVAALQSVSFSTIGPWTFNSAMTTGNLRTLTIGLVDAARHRERGDDLAKSRALAAIVACFTAGALAGAAFTRAVPAHPLALCLALAALGTALTFRASRRRLARLRAEGLA